MIVVEGPDGAGKSTLCQRIVEDYGFLHGERATKDRDKLYTVTRYDTYGALYSELMCGPVKVWDRLGPWSDPIYSNITDRPCAFTPGELYLWKVICRNLRIPIIICLPDYLTVLNNAIATHQMAGVKDNLYDLYHEYERLLVREWVGHQVRYDYETDNYDAVKRVIDSFLGYRKERELCSSYSTPVM